MVEQLAAGAGAVAARHAVVAATDFGLRLAVLGASAARKTIMSQS